MRSRPPHRWARITLAWGILSGVGMLVYLQVTKPEMLGVNLETYLLAAEHVAEPSALYRVSPPDHPALTWVYPPIVVLSFVPAVWLEPWLPIELIYGSLLLVVGVLLGGIVIILVESRIRGLGRIDRILILGFTTLGLLSAPSLYYGNLNPLLVFLVGLALLSMERGQETRAGIFLALPAVVKIFPAAFGLWLLLQKSWRGVAGMLGTVLFAALASIGIFGLPVHRTYVLEALLPRRRTGIFEGGLPQDATYVTLRRPLSVLFPDLPHLLGPLALLLLLPLVALIVRRADPQTTTGSILILHAIIVWVLLVLPSYTVYLLFVVPTVVALLFLLPSGHGRTLVVAGTASTTIPASLGPLRDIFGSGFPVDLVASVLAMASPQLIGLLLTLIGAAIAASRPELHRG